MGLYKTFHGGPKLSMTKTIFDLIDEHLEQARSLGSHLNEDMEWMLHYYEQARAAFTAAAAVPPVAKSCWMRTRSAVESLIDSMPSISRR